mmetsp:Transcript_122727/g.216259  ORF Transcript_122727/g.216259 Transcript_122727/m.216259 type:complete len:216 (-) Transcript_122727:84-731(-)
MQLLNVEKRPPGKRRARRRRRECPMKLKARQAMQKRCLQRSSRKHLPWRMIQLQLLQLQVLRRRKSNRRKLRPRVPTRPLLLQRRRASLLAMSQKKNRKKLLPRKLQSPRWAAQKAKAHRMVKLGPRRAVRMRTRSMRKRCMKTRYPLRRLGGLQPGKLRRPIVVITAARGMQSSAASSAAQHLWMLRRYPASQSLSRVCINGRMLRSWRRLTRF